MVAILYGYSKVQEIDAVSTYLHGEIDGGIESLERRGNHGVQKKVY